MSLVVVKALGLVTRQGLPQPGRMHEAVPPAGALVPELLVTANRRADNLDGALAIEVMGTLVVRATAEVRVATDRAMHALRAGDELAIASGERRCTYLALRGGITGHAALLCAGLGGPLRPGEVLASAHAAEASTALTPFDERDEITLVPGPDLDAFAPDALAQLTSAPYRILPTSDRTGTRLAGPALLRATSYRDRSRPMVIGAFEVPADGQPIVLGPEHPTTGGYPVIAVIASADLGRFASRALGTTVRFTAPRARR